MNNNTLLTKLGFQDIDHKSSKHDAAVHFVYQPEILRQIHDAYYSHRPCGYQYPPSDHMVREYSIPGEVAQFTMTVDPVRYSTESPIVKGRAQYKQTIGFVDGVIDVKRRYMIKSGYQPVIFEVTPDELELLKKGELERYPGAFCLPDTSSTMDWCGIKAQIGITGYDKKFDEGYHLPPGLIELFFHLPPGLIQLFFHLRRGDVFPLCIDNEKFKERFRYIQSCNQLVKGYRRIDNYELCADYMQWNIETKFHKTSAADIIRQVKLYREYKDGNLRPEEIFWFTLTFFDLSDTEQSELSNAGIYWIRMGHQFDQWWKDQQHIPKRARLVL